MLAEKRRTELDQMKTLKSAGLPMSGKLPRLRTMIGTDDGALVERLKSIDSVEMDRPQHKFRLPPADKNIPQ